MTATPGCSRREFLATAAAIPLLDWLPFVHRKYVGLAGARFRIHRNGRSPRRFLLIHGNEETARSVLLGYLRNHEGMVFVIESHQRNVSIEGGEIDPNRMFSRAGAEANLKALNSSWTPERVQSALALLDRGRNKLVKAFFPPPGGFLAALHNNSESYSVNDEVPISDSVSLREPANPHCFFLCTDPEDFKILATSPYNVVLQRHGPREDDGSLSRLAAAQGVRYVNLEVAHGRTDRQQEMLSWLEWHLPEERKPAAAKPRQSPT